MNKIFLPATAAVLSFGVASSALASVPHVARYPHEMVMAGAAAQPKSLRGEPHWSSGLSDAIGWADDERATAEQRLAGLNLWEIGGTVQSLGR
jgi:hypothetical protein